VITEWIISYGNNFRNGVGSFIPEIIQESTARVRQSSGIEIGGGGDSIKFNTIPFPANSIAGTFTRPGSGFLNDFRYRRRQFGPQKTGSFLTVHYFLLFNIY
jgi:hypothetical protein